jgi:hypothetical protein
MTNHELSSTEFNKDAYLALTHSNNLHFEDQIEEFIGVLADDDEENLDALRGVMIATLSHLAIQRKLDRFLTDNVPEPSEAAVEYSLEVAENLGIKGFSTKPTIVVEPEEVNYKALLDLIYSN